MTDCEVGVLVSGVDMFFTGVEESFMRELGSRLSAKVTYDVGCGVLTRFNESPKFMSKTVIFEELAKLQELGNSLAQERDGSYSGAEFYIDSCSFSKF